MAGAGYKLFNTGDVLTAAQVNTYLQEQVVMVFANAAARTTALSGVLAEGMVTYLKDTDVLEIYSGTAWVGYGSGDITGVTTGATSGLTGGVASGTADLKLNTTAKGGLLVGTGSGTVTELSVGSNNTVLTADSSTASGLKWATASSGTFPILTVSKYASNFSTSSTSFTDMTGYSITRTPVSATNNIEIKLSFTCTVTTGMNPSIKLLAGATSLLENAFYIPYNAAAPQQVNLLFYASNVAASSTTFKAQIKVDTGTITVYGTNSGYNSVFSTLEVY